MYNFWGNTIQPQTTRFHTTRRTDTMQAFTLFSLGEDSFTVNHSTEEVANSNLGIEIFTVPFTVVCGYEGQGEEMMPKLESANECLRPYFCSPYVTSSYL